MLEQFQQGMEKPEQQSILKFSSPSDLEKVLQNFDAWIPSLVKEAVDANKIGANRIDDLNKRISDPEKRIDLNHIPKLDQAAGIDPLVEELKKQSGPESDSFAEEQRVIRDNRQRLSALLDKLEEDRRQIDQTNSQTSEQMNRQALEALLALLDPSARQQFLENQKKNGQTQTVSSSNSGGSSSGESSSSDSTPSAPQIVSPSCGYHHGESGGDQSKGAKRRTVQIYNGSELVGTKEMSGDSEADIKLNALPEGTYRLTARTVRGGERSAPVSLPAITVVDPGMPELISPVTDTVFGPGMVNIRAKAPAGSKSLVLNGDTILAGVEGKGAEVVTIPRLTAPTTSSFW
ncbi:hypothetical protein LJK88_33865 [Paenibacillus sp. P26]|nr:hypothetical protein LJK88_33865 [Paenibacillus sp. P26]